MLLNLSVGLETETQYCGPLEAEQYMPEINQYAYVAMCLLSEMSLYLFRLIFMF